MALCSALATGSESAPDSSAARDVTCHTSHVTAVPPEIFSFLVSEARVLVACSQAHPIFAQLVEPTLYVRVILHDHDADAKDEHHLKFKPYQLSTLLSDKPRINYLRSLRVEVPELYFDDEAMKAMITILPGLKLERIQLSFAHSEIIGDWKWPFVRDSLANPT